MCTSGAAMDVDPDHFHSCTAIKSSLLSQRHNNIVQVLQELANSVGFTCIREPTHHIRPEENSINTDKYHDHADLLLLKYGAKIYVDVSITRPTNESNVRKSGKNGGASVTPLFATRTRSSGKHLKYDKIAEKNGYRMVPFVMETYGGMGPEAQTLLHNIAAHSTEYSPEDFLAHARKRLSVTLQSSNADIAQLAMQRFHLREQLTYRNARYGKEEQERDARNKRKSYPCDGDRLEVRVQEVLRNSRFVARMRGVSPSRDDIVEPDSEVAFVHRSDMYSADVASGPDMIGNFVGVAA
jgi:hypothetical protein